MSNFHVSTISINEYSKIAFNSRRGKIIREGRICFYDLAEELVKDLVAAAMIIAAFFLGNFAFSFYMRNGEYHKGIDTLKKYESIFEVAKKITDTKYNSLVLFEAMKIWDKLDYFYVLDFKSTVFENGAESVKFSMMQ